MATNVWTKIAINCVCVNDSDSAIGYVGGLSGRPTECRYCRYPAHMERCYGNQFLAFDGYNIGCMIASDTLFDSRCGFSGSSYPIKT